MSRNSLFFNYGQMELTKYWMFMEGDSQPRIHEEWSFTEKSNRNYLACQGRVNSNANSEVEWMWLRICVKLLIQLNSQWLFNASEQVLMENKDLICILNVLFMCWNIIIHCIVSCLGITMAIGQSEHDFGPVRFHCIAGAKWYAVTEGYRANTHSIGIWMRSLVVFCVAYRPSVIVSWKHY